MQRKSHLSFLIIVLIGLGTAACLPASLLKESRAAKKSGKNSETDKRKKKSSNGDRSEPVTIEAEKDARYVNVMGNETPEMPDFDDLSPEPGKVRGYVKDFAGNPIEGARLGVRSTAAGGFYSGAQGQTDADGYYEFDIPSGVAHFYNAGHAIEWGDGLAAVGLHPADGELESFASPDGAVENFVLLPYGVTSRANAQENPHLPSSYYGGAVYVGYFAAEAGDQYAPPANLRQGAEIEITLTADGEMLADDTPRSFTVRKTVGFETGFYISNIPLGRYKISVTSDGEPLKMSLIKPRGTPFGMKPGETTGEADLVFAPSGAKADMATPQFGGWDAVQISVERQ